MASILSAVYSLGIATLVILIAIGLGLKLLRPLHLPGWASLEQGVFAAALGLGALGYAVLALGLLGLFRWWMFVILLVAAGLFAYKEILETAQAILKSLKPELLLSRLTIDEKILVGLCGVIGVLALVQTLTPVWDYDGLMYHLQGPRLFLQAGRIYQISGNWMASYPFTLEMLFTLGLGLGSEEFSRLVHLTYAILLALATYLGAKRYAGRGAAWLSTAILLGIPIYPVWATLAYCDIGWALYEFLGVLAVLFWLQPARRSEHEPVEGLETHPVDRQTGGWLILAGIMMGFAMGTKYIALSGAFCLGLVILWYSRQGGWKAIFKNGVIYGTTALMVASPWYIKNLLWTGNPIYPLYFTQNGEVAELYKIWMDYVNGFGAPRTLTGYLSLPILIYTQFPRFGTFMGSIDIPSPLFPLALLYPLTRRTRMLNALGLWAILRFVAWALGTQQLRMMLPLNPALSILAAYVLVEIAVRLPATLGRALPRGLGFGLLAATLAYLMIYFLQTSPLYVILGIDTKDAFLQNQLHLYPALQYIDANIQPQERVWMLWDGRGYYCDERCVPDVAQTRWAQLAQKSWDAQLIADELKSRRATHLLVSYEDWDFISRIDRGDIQKSAFRFLQEEFLPACTRDLYTDEFYRLVELTCE